ncbi:IPT/TIG domain-containing protein [Nocardia sp. NPDC049190]|uniref:IPT/TIG domain-containing protein n=1 Tax=Nocardia sp. NPDC049190 TaxID=3155650 RepID=UPI0033CAC944
MRSGSYRQGGSVLPISPSQGETGGGTTVAITGTNLGGATAVHFGSKLATITDDTTTSITAVSPSGAGAVPVTVTTEGGTSNPLSYFYVAAPFIGTLSSVSGVTAGGNTVTITGTGLSTASAVHFGAASAIPTVVNDSQATVVAPAGTGTVSVTVTTAGGTSNGLSYTYVPVPTLTSVSPTSGSAPGGGPRSPSPAPASPALPQSASATVATSLTVNSSTQIAAVAPAGTGTVCRSRSPPPAEPATGCPSSTSDAVARGSPEPSARRNSRLPLDKVATTVLAGSRYYVVRPVRWHRGGGRPPFDVRPRVDTAVRSERFWRNNFEHRTNDGENGRQWASRVVPSRCQGADAVAFWSMYRVIAQFRPRIARV